MGLSDIVFGNEEALAGFITKWNLSDDAQQLLFNAPHDVQQKVLTEFNPRDASRDVHGIFLRFLQSRSQAAQSSDQMTEFVSKWNLGPDAEQILAGLSPMIRVTVMQDFAPRDTSSDVNNIFMKFAQCTGKNGGKKGGFKGAVIKGKGFGKAGGKQTFVQAPHNQAYLPEHEQFLAKWRLGESAQQLFYGLQPDQQQKVMMEFSPRDTSSDANNIFMKFCQGVSKGTSGSGKAQGQVQPFLAQWRLGPDAQGLFFSLLPQQQQRVMLEFSPRDTTSDANNIFMKFCQGVARGTSGAPSKGFGKTVSVGAPVVHAGQSQEENFLAQWRLGADAQQVFYGLLPDQQEQVMLEFSPRDASSDCNNIFMRFCQGLARGSSSGKGKGKARSSPY